MRGPGCQQQKSRKSGLTPSGPGRAGSALTASLTPVPGGLAAVRIHEPPPRNSRQPGAGIVRRAIGPDPHRLEKRLLQRILRGVEILAPPDQAREHPRDEGAERALVHPERRLVAHDEWQSSAGAPDMISRTSSHSYSGSPPGPGSEET